MTNDESQDEADMRDHQDFFKVQEWNIPRVCAQAWFLEIMSNSNQ